jgi:hypothetical protein
MTDFHLHFDPKQNSDSLLKSDGWTRYDAGRLVIQNFVKPRFHQPPKVTVHMTLRSAGDPWDKSGTVFMLPQSSDINLIDFEEELFTLDTTKHAYPAIQPFESPDGRQYQPTIELLRFITPFGVGHFSNQKALEEYRPVYVPQWAESVQWTNDISHLWDSMEDTIALGVYLDTWTQEGYTLDLRLEFEPRPKLAKTPAEIKTIPLFNTTKLSSKQQHFDGFSQSAISVDFDLPANASQVTLHYLATGHGGHSTGDEFVRCLHQIELDDVLIDSFTPWRDDCASLRRFNPSSGVWTESAFWKGDSIQERIASSDYSRSGWCPGDQVQTIKFLFDPMERGNHNLKISVPTAQVLTESEMNFWNVAGYLSYHVFPSK